MSASNIKQTASKKKLGPSRTFLSKGLSIHPEVYEKATARAESLHISFSQYVAQCLKNELANGVDSDLRITAMPKVTKPKPPSDDKW